MVLGYSRRFGPMLKVALAAYLLSITPSLAETTVAAAAAVPAGPPAPSAASQGAAAPDGTALAGDHIRTRFLIGLEKSVEFQVFSLSNPNRVIVDLPEVKLQLPDAPTGNAVGATGLVSSFRGGLAAPGKTRVVIDVTEPVVVESAKIEKGKDGKGPRLALQIVPVEALTKAAAKQERKAFKSPPPFALGGAGLQPPMARPAMRPDAKAAKAFKQVIVLDPGHGGHDSGAEKNGAVEKDIVLAFGKLLRDKLNKTGRYKVLMTRDEDKFIELSERVDFAERNKAALFIAIHCDYAQTKARGATIYSLRDGTAESLKRSAKGEIATLSNAELEVVKKGGDDGDVNPTKSILADLAQRLVDETKERTNIFTNAVVGTMSESTTMRDEPDQSAGFRVLKTAQFPSVLIELAYVTNKEDAENLMSDSWRDKVSDSIQTAIDSYFSNQIARLPM